MSEKIDPLHQFEIHRWSPFKIGALDLSFTNSAFWMLLAVAVVSTLLVRAVRGAAAVPGRAQSAAELLHGFVFNTAKSTLGEDDARRYFPFIFTVFLFVLGCNVIGLIPYSFTPTSHLAVTGAMAVTIFVGVTALGFYKHGVGYLRLFVPHGLPKLILPLVVLIEIVSYFARPLTHSMRLFANMVAGHVMVKVLAEFAVMLGPIGGTAPLTLMIPVTALEALVAFLQAYVFTAMTCLYLRDALHPDH